MGEKIIENLNSVISPEDELYCLGDFAFGGVANYFSYRPRINCKNIHLILGNHDSQHGKVFDPEHNGVKTSSLFTSYMTYKEMFYNKTRICLFHYPISSWNEMSGGSILLHGHCHRSPQQKFDNGGRSMDVGLDGNNLMPYSIDEIFELLKDKNPTKEGHHA